MPRLPLAILACFALLGAAPLDDTGPEVLYGDLVLANDEARLDLRAAPLLAWALLAEEIEDERLAELVLAAPTDSWQRLEGMILRVEQLPYLPEGWSRVRVRIGDFDTEADHEQATDLLSGLAARLALLEGLRATPQEPEADPWLAALDGYVGGAAANQGLWFPSFGVGVIPALGLYAAADAYAYLGQPYGDYWPVYSSCFSGYGDGFGSFGWGGYTYGGLGSYHSSGTLYDPFYDPYWAPYDDYPAHNGIWGDSTVVVIIEDDHDFDDHKDDHKDEHEHEHEHGDDPKDPKDPGTRGDDGKGSGRGDDPDGGPGRGHGRDGVDPGRDGSRGGIDPGAGETPFGRLVKRRLAEAQQLSPSVRPVITESVGLTAQQPLSRRLAFEPSATSVTSEDASRRTSSVAGEVRSSVPAVLVTRTSERVGTAPRGVVRSGSSGVFRNVPTARAPVVVGRPSLLPPTRGGSVRTITPSGVVTPGSSSRSYVSGSRPVANGFTSSSSSSSVSSMRTVVRPSSTPSSSSISRSSSSRTSRATPTSSTRTSTRTVAPAPRSTPSASRRTSTPSRPTATPRSSSSNRASSNRASSNRSSGRRASSSRASSSRSSASRSSSSRASSRSSSGRSSSSGSRSSGRGSGRP